MAPALSPVACTAGREFIRGDADANGVIEITDGIFVLNFLFQGGVAPLCDDAPDADDNGAIEITDPIYTFDFLFLGGLPPPAPSPSCGTDPTADCLAYPACH